MEPVNGKPTVEIYPLEKRKIIKKTCNAMFGFFMIFAIAAVISFFALPVLGLLLLFFSVIAFIALAVVIYLYQVAYFKSYYYDLRQDFLVIKKGVFMPRETTLPYDKFQDVYMDQDIWDRIFSLWDLHVSTATFMSGWEAHIDGVSVQNGETMKKMVLEKINESKKGK
jgi:membrane protein YdbS with pleckstrin-like domain